MSESINVVNIDGKDRRPWAVASRELLLRAAIAEIAERGYEHARLVDIAARADMTVGAIYNWFENKSMLFGAALAREMQIPFISNQPQYSMLWRIIEQEVVPASQDAGMSQIVWSPIAQGVLSGKYLPGQPPPPGSRATDELSGKNFIARWLNDDVLQKVQLLKPIAQQAGISMATMSIAWVLQNKNVASAIVGATRPEQLDDSVNGAGLVLDTDTLKAIDKVLDGVIVSDPRKTESPTTRP